MLFGVNTLGAHETLTWSPHTDGEEKLGKTLPFMDPLHMSLHISRMAEARDLKYCMHIEGWSPNEKVQM